MNTQDLLQIEPFVTPQTEKIKLLTQAIQSQAIWHYKQSKEYRAICDGFGFDPKKKFEIVDLPYIPVSLFKKFDLCSVPKQQIIRTLFSSSTSGSPSKVLLDAITSKHQVVALSKIMNSFLGKGRRHFIIFDAEQTVQSIKGNLNSRGTAIRGLIGFASSVAFVLNDKLKLDEKKLVKALQHVKKEDKVCIFGFTWLLYATYLSHKNMLHSLAKSLKQTDTVLLHIGGWKKLTDMAVTKTDFNKSMSQCFGVKESHIIDFYGMTEQLGTVYPDCEFGFKHTPLYSEIIIRDIVSLQPLPKGSIGFIQLISPIPHSYPGISLLSDDMGQIMGVDSCRCGRKGTYFRFVKRSEKAELKGCGDSLTISI